MCMHRYSTYGFSYLAPKTQVSVVTRVNRQTRAKEYFTSPLNRFIRGVKDERNFMICFLDAVQCDQFFRVVHPCDVTTHVLEQQEVVYWKEISEHCLTPLVVIVNENTDHVDLYLYDWKNQQT